MKTHSRRTKTHHGKRNEDEYTLADKESACKEDEGQRRDKSKRDTKTKTHSTIEGKGGQKELENKRGWEKARSKER